MSFFTIILNSCENDIAVVNNITQKENYPVEVVKKLEVLYSDSGIVKAKIVTPELNKYLSEHPYTELPKGVSMYFYDSYLNVTSTLTADYARRDDVTKMMEARKNVVVVNNKGDKLNTEKLIWNENTGMFSSDVFVKVTKEKEIIFGNGFEANQDFSKYKFKDISGIISIDKK